MIIVANVKDGAVGERIYRGQSVLGNPFSVKQYGREECIRRYEGWLRVEWAKNAAVREELLRLARKYKKERKLTLVCFCAPLACHGDVLSRAIKALIKKGLV